MRVSGPYPHGQRWRVNLRGGDGKVRHRSFATRAAAQAYINAAQGEILGGAVTVGDAVKQYLASVEERGLASCSVERIEYHLRRLLDLADNAARPITWLRGRGAELYDRAREGRAADTHHNALNAGKVFGAWCVKKRWLRADPFAEVEPTGRKRAGRGKPQLRVDEATKLIDHLVAAIERAGATDPEPIAVLAALLLGTRATELVTADVRDLDAGGTLFWIDDAKTDSGRRTLDVPEVLRPFLRQLARGKRGGDALFVMPGRGKRWPPRRANRHWLLRSVRKWCASIGLDKIPSHGLRRSHATIARSGGSTAEAVAAQLGHGSTAVQARSYVARGAAERGQARAVMQVLQGGKR